MQEERFVVNAEKINKNSDGSLNVPDNPMIPFIEGDGIGPDIWRATRLVIDAAVEKTYSGSRNISWMELPVGEKGYEKTGSYLPQEALDAIEANVVAIKGPLTTPIGKGIRSLNVAIRQKLDLYACVRPVRYIETVPSPMKHPEKINMVVFRENTEDLYAGIEWASGTDEAKTVVDFFKTKMGVDLPPESGIGIKPISPANTKRLVVSAIVHALENGFSSVTLMHKGNIMKFTEGAFAQWGYQVAMERFADRTITEAQLYDKYDGAAPEGKVVIKDRIADMLFQQVLLRPDEYGVIATSNLNGDYISDALAAGLDKVNPGSLILSGAMMLDYMGWKEAGTAVRDAVQAAIKARRVTYDLARQIEGAQEVKCSQFAAAIVGQMK
ncbi:MAG: NADP-dependent isocitrate dehydrogenase [Desulfosarcina sp.]|nr:NADP-dependent isocitrate dehydrogenase [Desulfosarcina sp.]